MTMQNFGENLIFCILPPMHWRYTHFIPLWCSTSVCHGRIPPLVCHQGLPPAPVWREGVQPPCPGRKSAGPLLPVVLDRSAKCGVPLQPCILNSAACFPNAPGAPSQVTSPLPLCPANLVLWIKYYICQVNIFLVFAFSLQIKSMAIC